MLDHLFFFKMNISLLIVLCSTNYLSFVPNLFPAIVGGRCLWRPHLLIYKVQGVGSNVSIYFYYAPTLFYFRESHFRTRLLGNGEDVARFREIGLCVSTPRLCGAVLDFSIVNQPLAKEFRRRLIKVSS